MTRSFFDHLSRLTYNALSHIASIKSDRAACLLVVILPLTACQHRGPVEITRDLSHDLMGGEIKKLHPLTPGYNTPAPNIAFTPTTIPEFPSPENRAMITTRLEQDRNLTQHVGASGGALPIGMVNPLPPRTQHGGATTLNSSSQPPALEDTPAPPPARISSSGSTLIYQPISHKMPTYLPDPGHPPKPVLFPGFTLPDTARSLIPNFDTTTPTGTLIRFQSGTDRMVENQTDRFNEIIAHRRHHRLVIRGFGTTLTAQAGLSPTEQANEIALALLRARAVAQQLTLMGVSASDMRLTGEPIGDGVRVSYELNIKPTQTAQR
ncbi:OmpA family protein [Bombella saccharophila]|uniref:OmpA-like domain-containing protein n=1 Tax=Bombella saccharophila TaxID=2967338 RepID=A0ABT3W6G7_9PROT|nr:hypothetical protein [Bombella saccharophila]MCX5614662.1 hypothetical protein [Bombella saccharophila]